MTKVKNFINSLDVKNANISTIVRLLALVVAGVYWVLKGFGVTPPAIDQNVIVNVVMLVFGAIAAIQSYWKNNSWTTAAQEADNIMKDKKTELEQKEEV